MVDLQSAPFNLNEEDCRWVRATIAQMSAEEKVGQLFFGLCASFEEEYLRSLTGKYHLGGCRYNTASAAEVRKCSEILQNSSAIPLFIACNTESGGDNACTDGTFIASGLKIAAAGKKEYAYALGKTANAEAAAVGCNMAFAPVCDIAYNWENTEVISRSFGNDPARVAEMSCEYLRGALSIGGFACAAKHFPGNGLDFRDAHLSNNVNDLAPESWEASYGLVYKKLIAAGLPAIMAGHIMLPQVSKALNKRLADEEILPASLSSEIINGLLRERLGFNGLVITDATHMVGMTCRMKRAEMLPQAINAGCDMLLFFNDPDEDFAVVLKAYQTGIISEERMTEALERILGLKAQMGLYRRKTAELVPAEEEMRQLLGKEEYRQLSRAVSADAITLVKYKDKDVLPLSPERYKRIMLVKVKGAQSAMNALIESMLPHSKDPAELLRDRLIERGFDAFIYENLLDKVIAQARKGQKVVVNEFFLGKSAVADFTAQMDLVITVCDVASGRPVFGLAKGGGEIPWYVFEVPVIVIGCKSPTMLADIPQARTYINTYDAHAATMEILADKHMQGPQAFCGQDPIDSFCGLFDTHL